MATKVERWVAADGTEFYTRKAAVEHDFIESAVCRFMDPKNVPYGRSLLGKMMDAGYRFLPPEMAQPPA